MNKSRSLKKIRETERKKGKEKRIGSSKSEEKKK